MLAGGTTAAAGHPLASARAVWRQPGGWAGALGEEPADGRVLVTVEGEVIRAWYRSGELPKLAGGGG
jgi:hypothetical protein